MRGSGKGKGAGLAGAGADGLYQIAAGRCYTYSPDLIDPPYEFRTFSIVSMIDSLRNKLKECAAEEVERQKDEILK